MNLLTDLVSTHFNLNSVDKRLLKNTFYHLEVSSGMLLKKQDTIAKYIYFVCDGITKGYHYKDGKVIVEHITNKGRFTGSFNSFISGEPNHEIFEAITDCILLKISKPDFDLLRNSGKKWNNFIQNMFNSSLSCKMKRVTDFQTKTAKERYLDFLNEQSDIALNISIEDTASFLGMEKQSLSRIRSEIRK